MPSRIVREGILTSERVNSLPPLTELFYRRLMSVVDDFGRFSANPSLLRASCYPLQLDSVKEDSIKKHLAACANAGLIVLFTVAGKAYLEMQDFRQRTRASESRYPSPDQADDAKKAECKPDGGSAPANCTPDASHVPDTCPTDDGHAPDACAPYSLFAIRYSETNTTNQPRGGELDDPEPPAQRPGAAAFPMHIGWKPSEHMPDQIKCAAVAFTPSQYSEWLAEFITHWLGAEVVRTQAEWDKAWLQCCIWHKNNPKAQAPPPPQRRAQAAPASRHSGFKDQTYSTENLIEDPETGGFYLGSSKSKQ